jgi:hypothetical protein
MGGGTPYPRGGHQGQPTKIVAKIAVADYLGVALAVASLDSAWMASGLPSVPAIATLRG